MNGESEKNNINRDREHGIKKVVNGVGEMRGGRREAKGFGQIDPLILTTNLVLYEIGTNFL